MKKNILLIITDDQKFNMLSCRGADVQTPNLDVLAANGVLFEQAHIQGGTVPAICMPSRAMIFSGRHLFHLTQSGSVIPEHEKTLPQVFREHGYETYGIGKWHNSKAAFARSFSNGEAIFFGGMWDHWNVPIYHYDPSGKYDHLIPSCPNFNESNEITYRGGDIIYGGKHSSELFSDAAIELIKQHDTQKPFLMSLNYLAPHDPRTMPKEYKEMYPEQETTLPPNFLPQYPFEYGASHIRAEHLTPFPRQENEIQSHISDYYAIITHLDAQIGRVIEALKEKGLYEQTVIIVAGDNGLAVGEHGMMGKQSMHEHSLRIPLIVSGPGVARGVGSQRHVYLYDLMATLCDMFGLETPATSDGVSFANECACPTHESDSRPCYYGYEKCQRALKADGYKLVEYVIDGVHTHTQLFDIENDRWELHDLSMDADHQARIANMRQQLQRAADFYDDHQPEFGSVFWNALN